MPDSVQSRPLLKITIAAIGILAGILAIGALFDFVDADPGHDNGTGSLTVAGETFTFTATTCFVSDDDFVAAGPGNNGTDHYWVSASSISLDLAVGTENEVDRPADDQTWLMSDEVTDWEADGQTVVAEAPMTDRRDPESAQFLGSLRVTCGSDT